MTIGTDDCTTSLSLLERLAASENQAEAWEAFVDRYGRLLFRWCRRWGLQESDAQDVTQETLIAVIRQIGEFQRGSCGSFRAWLRIIAHRCWLRIVRTRARQRISDTARVDTESLICLAARDDLARQFDEQAQNEILETAMARVRRRVEPAGWEAFRLTAIEQRPGLEVAELLGMRIDTVYKARSRIQKMLRKEVQALDADG